MKRPQSPDDLPRSVVLESSHGGIPVTICACGGLFVIGKGAVEHTRDCPSAQPYYDPEPENVEEAT